MHSKGTIRVPYSCPYIKLGVDCICGVKDGPFIAILCPLYDLQPVGNFILVLITLSLSYFIIVQQRSHLSH